LTRIARLPIATSVQWLVINGESFAAWATCTTSSATKRRTDTGRRSTKSATSDTAVSVDTTFQSP